MIFKFFIFLVIYISSIKACGCCEPFGGYNSGSGTYSSYRSTQTYGESPYYRSRGWCCGCCGNTYAGDQDGF